MKKDTFYVSVSGPAVLRKELLIGAKGVIGVLRGHQNFRTVRDEKQQSILQLKKILSDIASLNRKLRGVLPKVSVKLQAYQRPHEQRTHQEHHARSHVAVLEAELAKIEERLNTIE